MVWSPNAEPASGGGGGGIELVTGGITAPTSDYSHVIGATLSGGVLDGFRLQAPSYFASIEEKATGVIEVTLDSTGFASESPGNSTDWEYNGPALLLPTDVIGDGYIEVQANLPGSATDTATAIMPGYWSGSESNKCGLIGMRRGNALVTAPYMRGILRSMGTKFTFGPQTLFNWTSKVWNKTLVATADVTFQYAVMDGAPTYTSLAGGDIDRAGGVRHGGIGFGIAANKTEQFNLYALNWSYYPAP
jgi:hypothetical protein